MFFLVESHILLLISTIFIFSVRNANILLSNSLDMTGLTNTTDLTKYFF